MRIFCFFKVFILVCACVCAWGKVMNKLIKILVVVVLRIMYIIRIGEAGLGAWEVVLFLSG